MQVEILIVTFHRDLQYLRHCLASIDKFASGFHVTVVIPTRDVSALKALGFNYKWLTIKTGEEWTDKPMLWHQWVIMNADQWCKADFIAHLDADCILKAPVTPETYITDGKPVLRYEPFERVAQRVEAGVMAWKLDVEKCLPFAPDTLMETMRCQPLVYHRSTYPLARQLIAQHTGQQVEAYIHSCVETFPQGFCEFNTLGNVAMQKQAALYTLVEQHGDKSEPPNHVIQFWSHGAMDLKQMIWIDGVRMEVVPINVINQVLQPESKHPVTDGVRPLPESLLKIKHREQLGEWLNEQGLTGAGAEIGVMHGGYAEILLNTWKGQRYWMVDLWGKQPAEVYRERTEDIDYEAKYQNCVAIAARLPIVRILRDYSVNAANQVEDGSLDFVFIDGNHSYRAVLEDLDAWVPKVKRGGLIGLHDYYDCTTWPHFCEVKSAVDRWSRERNIPMHSTPCDSAWCIKP